MAQSENPLNSLFGARPLQQDNAASSSAGGFVKDTTTAAFTKDVLEESRRQPVLVDFWAPWCGPCKQLTPVLEKVVNAAGGKVRLVKMNIDDHPSIAGQLGIQSIPAVIAFVDGRPADGFMGAIPESQVKEFIERVAGPGGAGDDAAEIEAVLADAAALLAAGETENAAELFGAVVQAAPDNATAIAGLAECMLALGQTERAKDALIDLPEDVAKDPVIVALKKKIEQVEEADKLGDASALAAAVAANPDDHEARMRLAKILNVRGEREQAADHLLTLMRRDRSYDDDGARRQLLEFFEVWGPKDPATMKARRQLSSILFS